MAQDGSKPNQYDNPQVSLTNGNATRGVIFVDQYVAATGLDTLQPDLTSRGGCRILDGHIYNTGSACSILFYVGKVLTTFNTSVGSDLSVATATTITRAAGNFRSDGWGIGQAFMLFPPIGWGGDAGSSPSNTGVVLTLTGVSSNTLTFHSSTSLTAESLVSGSRLIRVGASTRLGVTLSAGNADATPPISMFGTTQVVDMASQPDRGLQFGPDNVLIVAAVSALPALPVRVDFTSTGLLRF